MGDFELIPAEAHGAWYVMQDNRVVGHFFNYTKAKLFVKESNGMNRDINKSLEKRRLLNAKLTKAFEGKELKQVVDILTSHLKAEEIEDIFADIMDPVGI